MSDADKYESDETEVSTASTDAGTKYYQISIPSYYLKAADDSVSDSSTGSSFLRLGSFPTGTSDTSCPSGFSNSYLLAQLIGDKTSILGAEASADSSPDDSEETTSYNGDHNYLLGFADDTRYRKDDTDDTWQARRSETTRLLTKGGWWDHSDGNRISTTAGDRIDVIQGNYKMLVLGRQSVSASSSAAALAAGALVTDISGGLMVENGPSPTHCIKSIEYVQEEGSDTWEVYQNNGIGNVYSSYYGRTVDVFFGTYKATWTGEVAKDYDPSDEDSDVEAVYKVYKKHLDIRTSLGELTTADKPIIMDHMWAKKIRDYKRVTGDIHSDVQANNIWTRTYAKFDDSGQGGQIQSDTIANTITTTTTAAAITNVNTALNNFNLTTGLQENISIGVQAALNLAAVIDVWTAGKINLNVSSLFDLTLVENKLVPTENKLATMANKIALASTSIAGTFTSLSEGDLTLSEAAEVVAVYASTLAAEVTVGV